MATGVFLSRWVSKLAPWCRETDWVCWEGWAMVRPFRRGEARDGKVRKVGELGELGGS